MAAKHNSGFAYVQPYTDAQATIALRLRPGTRTEIGWLLERARRVTSERERAELLATARAWKETL